MGCASCGSDLPTGVRFCLQCGAPQKATCDTCGTATVPGARFCGSCGTPVVTAPPPSPRTETQPASERRLCSVLFADLVGFTTLTERRDPEDVRELLSRYFEIARTIITRHGGVVEKFIGDAVMAVWGTPVATEDDAERAVRAGIQLVDAVQALGEDHGLPELAARAGVVTGEVAVSLGVVDQGMVVGAAVNTAARVQAVATPGTVFVDTTTRRLTAAAIGYADVGEHLLKGKAEPEQLWQATRVMSAVGGLQRVDGLEAGLIGRDSELRLVKELFHATADRRTPRLVVVAGAPGVGKSRLGWEFEKYVDGLAQEVAWHRGRCLSYGHGVAFWALAEAVRQRFSIAEDDPGSVAAQKMAAALPLFIPDETERGYVADRLARLLGLPTTDDGESLGRDELFAGWRIFFERMAAKDPVVLLIEDGQNADTGLLDFLDHLIDWARDLPIFVLVLTRPELEERRAGFGVGRNRTALTLDPLDAASMDVLVEALVPGIPVEAREAITSHAQGIPLFAVETVRSLVDRDVVLPIEGEYRLVGDIGVLAVPDSLHALLAARLDALPPAVRTLVSDAVVLGTSFPVEALVAVSDQSEDAVLDGLAELMRREVLEISADPLSPQRGEYRFAQQLLRQVAYDTLGRRERKRRHLAVAAHLRAAFPEDGEEVSDLIAGHYRDALAAGPDDPDAGEIKQEAVSLGVRAAERANRSGAPATAASIYASTAELAAEGGTAAGASQAAECWAKAADASRVADDRADGLAYADRAISLYAQANRHRDAARTQTLKAFLLVSNGQVAAARALLQEALAVLESEPDIDTVTALLQLAGVEFLESTGKADERSFEALELGQALDVGDVLMSRLFITRGIAHSTADRTAQAAASLEYAVRLAARAGNREFEALAAMNLSDALAPVDPAAAAEAARTAAERSQQVGARRTYAFAISNLVEALLTLGEWDEAHAIVTAALGEEAFGVADMALLSAAKLAALRGEEKRAQRLLDNELNVWRSSEDPQDPAYVLVLEALLAYAHADYPAALAAAREVVARAPLLGIRAESPRWAWPIAARAAHVLGDREGLEQLLGELDRYPDGKLPLVLRAERDLVRARVAAEAKDARAGALFERAIESFRRIPARYHLGHAIVDQVPYLIATGDLEAAEAALVEATEIAVRLGAAPLARRVAAARTGSRFG